MYGLNIYLQSFQLKNNLFNKTDKIRVSITTMPDENKEHFVIEAKKINNIHHFFNVNISKNTTKIIFVFRKKNYLQNDPIIASTIVSINQLPKSATDSSNTEMKNINIYEPLQNNKNFCFANQSRRVFGQMQIQFTPTDSFSVASFKDAYNNPKKNQSKSAKHSSFGNHNENCYQNDYILIDNKYY